MPILTGTAAAPSVAVAGPDVLKRLNLTAVLAVLAILDLVVDRLLGRLFLPTGGASQGAAWLLGGLGSFLSYLAGALALLLFASSFLGLIRRREFYPRSMRLVVSVLALVFVGLLTCCLANFQVPHRCFVQLKTTHAFLAALTAIALLGAGPLVNARAKLGVALFALPPILHTAALFISEMGWARGSLPPDLARIGELLAFLAAGAAPLLLPLSLRGSRFAPVAWGLGVLAVSLLVIGLWVKFDLIQVLALYGLRLDLPPLTAAGSWAYGLLFALAVLGAFLVVVPGLAAGGSDRLIAYGVIMIVTAGYQISSPPDMGIAACGLLALALGVARRPLTPPAETPAPVLTPETPLPART